MMTLAERAARTAAVAERFRQRPYDWRRRATCIHLGRAQARALGHRPPPIPDFRSAIGARTALRSTGHDTLADLLDSLFPRIAPAAMWVGDLAIVPGDAGFDAIAIAAGNGTLLMYHEDATGLANVKDAMSHVAGAWRL